MKTKLTAIVNGVILLPDREVRGGALLFDDTVRGVVSPDEAKRLGAQIVDAGGQYVSPGFVDVHIHGYLGQDVSDGSAKGIRTIAEGILHNGVTSFLPTTMTVSLPEIEQAFQVCRDLREESRTWAGAEILGVHAEGPFINPSKKGAQAEEHILPPDAEKLLSYKDIVRLITLAPEMPGAENCVRRLREAGITVSVGHTSADYGQTRASFDWGVDHATHTFNAMTGLLHRAPGTVGAVLGAEQVYCELIADTFHVHPGLFPLMVRAKGDRLVLITDCIRAGGLAPGDYTLGGQPVTVRGIECRLPDGTIAGSVLKMNDAVRNVTEHTSLSVREAVQLASRNPAASVRAENKGTLEPGKDADVILFDGQIRVSAVFRRGEKKL